ncbi:MAG TPA: heme o synthase [Actinomycetota bacterium]|nr:heme o synthase [Actinomycetota bacterium]
MTRFQKLALATTASVALLIAWGGLVRATGSGDGCPDWPTCYGRLLPPLEYHALIEYAHRLLANVAVPLIAATAVVAWRRHRAEPAIVAPAVAALVLVLLQAGLGGIVVLSGLRPLWVTAHLALAMLVLGALVWSTTASLLGSPARRDVDRGFARLAAATAAAVFALLLVGTHVRAAGAGLVFRDWPLMDGRLIPFLRGEAVVMFAHRLLAAAVTILVLWQAIRARAMRPRAPALVALTTAALGLLLAQVLVGAAAVWTRLSTAAVTAHVALSALIWGVVVAAAVTAGRLARSPADEAQAPAPRPPARETALAYLRLTKPRIVVLLLITTVPAMVLAAGGLPPIGLVGATLFGGTLAAGAANAVNCYLDRDIDEAMRRTRRRPLPAHQLTPEQALRFGYVLAVASSLFLAITVNVLAAALALSAIAFYVFVYTMWLKRTSERNIVIGGAAGAVPALVGWAAVTGGIGLPAWVLFAIVFVWTPPHFWALALRFTGDYAVAGVPMLPVVRGAPETRRQILLYSLALFGTSLLLFPVGRMGPIYLSAAIALGGAFVHRALRLYRHGGLAEAWGLFRFSVVYLGLLFAAVAADRLVPLP